MSYLPFGIFLLYVVAAVLLFTSIDRNYSYVRSQIRKAGRLNVRLKEKYQNDNFNRLMKNAGVPFSLYHYQTFRFAVTILMALMYIWKVNMTGNFQPVLFMSIGLFIIVTQPSEKMFGMKSPFQLLLDASLQRKRDIYNEELYLAISQMKNGFLANKDNPPSSQQIFEEVRIYTNRTREVFNKFIRLWMVGDKEMAVEYFDKEVGTKEAKKLSQVFLKLDDLNPVELREQLETFQGIYRTERETKKKKKNEFKSNILFIAVLGTAVMYMVNFLLVGFFIDFIAEMNDIL